MKKLLLIIFLLSSVLVAQEKKKNDVWNPLQFLIGKWEGRGEGKFGSSTVERKYKFIMGGTFILGLNNSFYEKQEKNPEGEIHDNWDIFSYDKGKKKYMLRQFHAEDIVNTYSMDSSLAAEGKIELITESIENFGTGWKAKEVYEVINENEFIEIFYLAPPGKDFTEYVRNTFKRIE